MKPWNRLWLVALLALALPCVALAESDSDPAIGTWMLNLSKSSFKPGPAPQSETRTFEAVPGGMIRLTIHQVAANGAEITETTTFRRDGKPYAFGGSPNMDAIEVRRTRVTETTSNYLRGGKVIGHNRTVLSKDGSTMTYTSTYRTPSGHTERDVRVYERQSPAR